MFLNVPLSAEPKKTNLGQRPIISSKNENHIFRNNQNYLLTNFSYRNEVYNRFKRKSLTKHITCRVCIRKRFYSGPLVDFQSQGSPLSKVFNVCIFTIMNSEKRVKVSRSSFCDDEFFAEMKRVTILNSKHSLKRLQNSRLCHSLCEFFTDSKDANNVLNRTFL